MKVEIYTHPEFERQLKQYAKKYRSIKNDYAAFLDEIRKNPYCGTDLGGGTRKVRMAIASKGKGKGGGARIITYTVNSISEEEIDVTLLYIYDKEEMDNVSDKFIRYLLAQENKQR